MLLVVRVTKKLSVTSWTTIIRVKSIRLFLRGLLASLFMTFDHGVSIQRYSLLIL